MLFWQREVAWSEGGAIAWGGYDPLRGPLTALVDFTAPVPDNMADPLVREALRSPEMRSFVRWSTMPIASVERGRCSARIGFGDARYGRTVRDNRFRREVTVPLANPGC